MQLVSNWKTVLLKSWSARFAAAGIAIPELLQLVADNTDMLPGLDPGWKSIIRMVCLAGVIIARPIQQRGISG